MKKTKYEKKQSTNANNQTKNNNQAPNSKHKTKTNGQNSNGRKKITKEVFKEKLKEIKKVLETLKMTLIKWKIYLRTNKDLKQIIKEKRNIFISLGLVITVIVLIIGYLLIKKISYQRKINQLLNYYQFKKEIEVDIEELFSAINDRDKKVLLIDLREKKDFEQCHFKTSINLSINDRDFLNKVNKLMKNKKEIVVYGQRGNDKNNFEAVVKLLSRGKLAKSLSFGWEEWKIIYGRNLFDKGVDLNKYIEPEGCLNYFSSYPGIMGPNFGPMPGFPNGVVPAPIMPGQ